MSTQSDFTQAYGLTIAAVFVPFSQSRNKAEKYPSLNWRVTLQYNGRDIITTDYSAGMAHCPAHNRAGLGSQNCIMRDKVIREECETGRESLDYGKRGKALLPDPCNVLHSLVMDSEALDYSTFEEWAESFGYDSDSRKGEAIYRACLEIALKMRAGLGESLLAQAREAFQEY